MNLRSGIPKNPQNHLSKFDPQELMDPDTNSIVSPIQFFLNVK